ncbi:MAG: 3'(2'),5'-bisphosphate nucleotidase [Gammaproteobacteria bacterium]|nr:3'(2'),5'-bisphosphate nucleotidase [Gammaproteobacteria bacterium]
MLDPFFMETALHAVSEACAVAREVQQALGTIKKLTKEDYSPVTVADFAAQALIALRLQESLGELRLTGEESAADLVGTQGEILASALVTAVQKVRPGLNRADIFSAVDLGNHDATGTAYWTLDPIDGTKGFLRGGQYAISLAYLVDGEVVLGVLGCPNLGADFTRAFTNPDPIGTVFFAERGRGAFSRAAGSNAAASPVQVARNRPLRDMRVCESVEAAHSRQDETQRIVEYLKTRGEPARLDSQCKYAVVARGQADAYIRLPTQADYVEKIWDHAAGMLVAVEAGATVTDIKGNPLDFSCGATLSRNRGIVCGPAPFHAAIVGAVEVLFG